ncbi:MAG: nucleotidyltransferase family protein [Polyangiaceae bacterium]
MSSTDAGSYGEIVLRLVHAESERARAGLELAELCRPEIAATVARLEAGAALYSTLRKSGELDRVPASLLATIRAEHASNQAIALELEAAARELSRAFATEAIPLGFLKGAVLLERGLLRDPGARLTCDLDLLTLSSDRERVLALLDALGFVSIGYGGAPKHLVGRRRGRVLVEVHEYAYWSADGAPQTLTELLREEDSLAFTAVHLVHHLLVNSWVEPWLVFKTISDFRSIGLALAASPALAVRTFELARRAGLLVEMGALLGVAESVATGAPIASCDRWLVDSIATEHASRGRKQLEYLARSFLRAPRWYLQDLVREALLPSRSTMEIIHGLEPGSRWVYAAYAARPVRLAWRALEKARGKGTPR